MDLLCDNIMEEILLRLPLKCLHRLRAASRRYNAFVLGAGFTARYWRSHGPHLSGVFLQTEALLRPWGHRPCFLTASGRRPSATESVLASDLGFLPRLPQLHVGTVDPSRMIFIVHSSAGLLLCSRGREKQLHNYVCNPVTCQLRGSPGAPMASSIPFWPLVGVCQWRWHHQELSSGPC
uniref:F-box domain-containing protein n=1 Tax=Arundo donax TaxID=35708 RepID=A0A0A9BFY6_ARUDO